MTEGMRFRSKVDAWLVAALAALVGFPLLMSIGAMRSANVPGGALLLMVLPIAFVIWIFTTTFYVVTATDLVVRSGPVNRRIPLTSITGVRATRNPLSSPALSLDRLEIEYNPGRSILISPVDKEAFIQLLAAGGATVSTPQGTTSRATKQFLRVLKFFVLPLMLVIGVLIYRQSQPAVFEFSEGHIHIRTGPRQDIPVMEVIGLTLEQSMPRVLYKRNGLNLGQILHGHFQLDGVPDALLYLQASRRPPFVRLETRSRIIYINYSEPAGTRELYERLTREINK